MTVNLRSITQNKRAFEAELDRSRKCLRGAKRLPIDPQLIFRQAELIKLKREARYQFMTGFKFDRVATGRISTVCKIINPEGVLGGYFKVLSDPYIQNNAIIEKIRWDLAVLAGDDDVHAATGLFYPPLPDGTHFASHIQLHEEGVLLQEALDKKMPVPRMALLRSLILTIVYGGFDDHTNNMIYRNQKIIHFDNGGSLPSGSKFLDWGNYYLFCIRPMVLGAAEMDLPLKPDEIQFIKYELQKYINTMPLFEAYFDRPDVQKMVSKAGDCLMDSKKTLQGMRERIRAALDGVEGRKPLSPRQWIFRSFPLLRVALALHIGEKGLSSIFRAIYELCHKKLEEVILSLAEKNKNPVEIIQIALEQEEMPEIATLISRLPRCDKNTAERGANIALEFIKANGEFDIKNGIIEKDLNLAHVLSGLESRGVHLSKRDNQWMWNNTRVFIRMDGMIVCQNEIFRYPPLTVEEFAAMANGGASEKFLQFDNFVLELIKNNIPIASGKLHTHEKIKATMLPNTYRVFQVRDNTNERFILVEKDSRGNVYSRDIGLDLRAVFEARDKHAAIKTELAQPLIAEFINDDERYQVRPGECVGTYVIRVGKLELPPMYPQEMQLWIQGKKRQLGLLKALNELNATVQNPFKAPLNEGGHLLLQEKEASPMKFTIYQRPFGYPNVYSYRLIGEYRKGLRIVTETGRSFFLERKTLIARLKNGSKLDEDVHAGYPF